MVHVGDGPPDLLLERATVVDGTGAPAFTGSVTVRGDRIVAVERLGPRAPATPERGVEPGAGGAPREVVDATGLVLTPGFIDVHTHDDVAAVVHPELAFATTGGVTTCVVGNCGLGAAPWRAALATARVFHPDDDVPDWGPRHRGYLDLLADQGIGPNVAALAGHGTLRMGHIGVARRPLDRSEVLVLRRAVAEALEDGVLGCSSGLIYEPGCHADTDELVEVAEELAAAGGIYTSHIRNEGDALDAAVAEAIAVGERAGVPVQLSHHKAAGRSNWGKVASTLAAVDAARRRGVTVHLDQYPYTAASTTLDAVVAQGFFEPGPATGSPIELRRGGLGHGSGSDVVIASAAERPEWESLDVGTLAGRWGVSDAVAADRIVAAVPGATVVIELMCEDDVAAVMAHPATMIGSDGLPTLHARPHPRLTSTFARVLGHWARDRGLLPLEEAVHRMTGLPAASFGLRDRGVIRPGAHADLVLLDAGAVTDVATYADPMLPPAGIEVVWVNGTVVAQRGSATGARPGHVLRRG